MGHALRPVLFPNDAEVENEGYASHRSQAA